MKWVGSPAAWLVVLLQLAGVAPPAAGDQVVAGATNLAGLRALALDNLRLVADVDFTGTVCEADARNGILILQDAGVTELLELEVPNSGLQVGQVVRLHGKGCEVTRRRTGIGLRRQALVDNDGSHEATEKFATVWLEAGRHPLAVEWFNAGGAGLLTVEYAQPGGSWENIPPELLSHDAFLPDGAVTNLPGVEYSSYAGAWRGLPDFGSLPELYSGRVAGFDLGAVSPVEKGGVVFRGIFTVVEAGEYRFRLRSDDGSRLFVGDSRPAIELIRKGPAPVLERAFIGQIANTNDPGRWAMVEGRVRYASARGRRLELELRSPSNNRLQVDMLDSAWLPPALLLNSQVRLTGVGRQVFSAGGQSIIGLMSVSGEADIQIVEVPAETWLMHPMLPMAKVAAGTNLPGIVHLSGVLTKANDAGLYQFEDEGGRVYVRRNAQHETVLGQRLEALGVPVLVGTNLFLQAACFRSANSNGPAELPVLTTAQQVLQLSREEAARNHPVRLRGVITRVWPDDPRNFVMQDFTRGIFLQRSNIPSANLPQFGEFWEVEGVSGGGGFSPMVHVASLRRISDGRLPEPAHPEWDQLINGSLDNQFVELEGVVTGVASNQLTMLAHQGKIIINVFGESPPFLEQYENKLVRLRGCFEAIWDEQLQQVKAGEIRLGNLSINADQSLSADPFAASAKTVPELRRYDLQANAFRRVKVSGQFLLRRGREYFMMCGSQGLRFVPNAEVSFQPEDLIEVAGVADLRGVAPVLREAVARKVGTATRLPLIELPAEKLLLSENDSTRVVIEATLVAAQPVRDELLLELRAGLRSFNARVLGPTPPAKLEPGSRVRVTGVYDWQPLMRDGDAARDVFELLVRSPADIKVLSQPLWWTIKRLVYVLGILAGGLVVAGVWILLLRRQVERRTAQLERANRQREQAERARALDEERLRIARDLHDDLGSSLTEITMLGGMSLAENGAGGGDTVSQIVKKARDSVNALDVIVWAVNPKENSLQSLADYLASFADEFLTASGLACRLNLPVSFPAVTLDGRTRHDLFLATKEALNNAVRHARATEIELGIALEQGTLIISVLDNGAGFDRAVKSSGQGLSNLHSRLTKLGGECQIDSAPRGGTRVRLRLGLTAG